ncbi:MAG: ATP-binding protein, partial [Dehalococcoidales bacterium]
VYTNQAMIDIFGYESFDDFINNPYSSRYLPDYQTILKERWRLREKGEFVTNHSEHEIIRADGEKRDVETFTKKILWNGEESAQIIYNDITERNQMEKQLRHSQVLASLGEMTAGIAHEVGNPLASIILYSEVAMKGASDTRQTKKDLKIIHDEAKRAGNLMKDLLAYSRKLEPNKRQVNVDSVIEKVVQMHEYRLKVQDIRIITTELPEGPLNVNGDAAQLTQVFMNLIMNAGEALKKSGGGNITISGTTEAEWTKISITDDGPGIPEKYMDQIFLPFFTTKDIGEGTGLGLSIVYGIIAAHNGSISAENNEDGGATFTIRLPLYPRQ